MHTYRGSGIAVCFGVVLGLLGACRDDGDSPSVRLIQPGQEVAEKAERPVVLHPDGLEITFNGISEDSRCPLNTTCVWEGRAVAEFTFARGSEVVLGRLATPNSMPDPPNSLEVFGRRVTLVDVRPHPEDGRIIEPGEYEVDFRVD